jgi:hypothetical protein
VAAGAGLGLAAGVAGATGAAETDADAPLSGLSQRTLPATTVPEVLSVSVTP